MSKRTKSNLLWATFLAGALALIGLTGCATAIKQGDIVSITHRGLGIDVETVNNSTAAPTVRLGWFSSVFQFIPTSTNLVNAPRYMNAFDSRAVANPFDTSIRENTGTGDVYIGGTNDTSKAIVPSAFVPSSNPQK